MNEFRVICTDCGREYQNRKSGVWVKELFLKNKEVYRIWLADRMVCPECGKMVIARFADNPLAEHWNKEIMAGALRECEKKKLGFDLFEWKEFFPKKKGKKRKEVHLRSPIRIEKVTQGKPEDA